MKHIALPLAALAASIALSGPASAAVIGTYEHDYGIGQYNPPGADQLGNDFVTIRENRPANSRFIDTFDFSELAGQAIESFTLILDYSGVGPTLINFGGTLFDLERWEVNILGSQNNSTLDDLVVGLSDANSPQSITFSAATDVGGVNAFATALANLEFSFIFDEVGFFNTDTFRLNSATLIVNGTTAVVPLPAPGLLLLAALGGLGLMRRRKARQAEALPAAA
ncbi:VPLPA-CTERM sorting domain-containing protein [Jannaschia pohangensis]|uniref:VPLPA-CTERM protein sorting domain-containing protein n=1 Tax=Jannaschia pohangensis TaxID=390807 RepID=A0A1I3R5Z8_9RHOB|nr:VPLPA-CTERM sorting domain-containing protein [Jannaschia pohangensis]SFJ41069.1 VPLPA-CTERM protein sorting domain-containing protein [Jannaschia pohangensis]